MATRGRSSTTCREAWTRARTNNRQLETGNRLQTEAFDAVGVSLPVLLDFDAEGEEDRSSESGLQVVAGLGAYLAEDGRRPRR